ncbi:hypothetical protein FHR49_000240 [Xanthomonas campestris]
MLRAENRAHAALHAIVVASTASVAVSPQATLPQPTIRRVRCSAESDCVRAPRMGLLLACIVSVQIRQYHPGRHMRAGSIVGTFRHRSQ